MDTFKEDTSYREKDFTNSPIAIAIAINPAVIIMGALGTYIMEEDNT